MFIYHLSCHWVSCLSLTFSVQTNRSFFNRTGILFVAFFGRVVFTFGISVKTLAKCLFQNRIGIEGIYFLRHKTQRFYWVADFFHTILTISPNLCVVIVRSLQNYYLFVAQFLNQIQLCPWVAINSCCYRRKTRKCVYSTFAVFIIRNCCTEMGTMLTTLTITVFLNIVYLLIS